MCEALQGWGAMLLQRHWLVLFNLFCAAAPGTGAHMGPTDE